MGPRYETTSLARKHAAWFFANLGRLAEVADVPAATGERGRRVGGMDHHLPDRGQAASCPRRDAGPTGYNARERDTGERRATGAGMGWSRSLWASGYVATPGPSTDATSARERGTGERGPRVGGMGRHLPDRGRRRPRWLTSGRRGVGHRDATSAREYDTGERGLPGREWWHLPDRGQTATSRGREGRIT
jgi:hypothetical protein